MKNKHLFNKCHFSYRNSIHFEMRAATKKISVEEDALGFVRSTWARDTFFLTVQKRNRKDKREKVENRVKSQSRISIDVNSPKEKVHIPPWDATVAVTVLRWGAKRKDLTATAIFKKLYVLPERGTQLCPTT